MRTQKSKNLLHKINLRYLLVGLVLLSVGAAAYFFLKGGADNTALPNPVQTQAGELTPATAEETAQAENHKQQLANEKTPSAPTASNPTKTTPLITYAGQTNDKIEVIGFVPGISEDGGKCKLRATQGQLALEKEVPANRNSNTTDCQMFTIARAEFPAAGNWSLVISYSSNTASGDSEPYAININ